MKKKTQKTVWWVVGAVILVLFLDQGRKDLTPGGCTFPVGGGTCTQTLTLPENRSYNNLTFGMMFGTEAGAYHDWVVVPPPTEILLEDPGDRYHNFLFHVPAQSDHAYDVDFKVTAIGQTDQGTTAMATLKLYHVNIPYASDGINTCDSYDNDCTSQSLIDNYRHSVSPTGGPINYLSTLTSLGTSTIVANGEPTGTTTLTVTIPPAPTFPSLSDNAFLVVLHLQTNTGQIVDVNPPTHAPTDVQLRYREHEYPTTLEAVIGTNTLFTLIGEQNESLVSQDLAEEANAACGRPTNTSACSVDVVWTSTTAGRVDVTENRLLKIIGGTTCDSNWTCGNWTTCTNGNQTRTCTDRNACDPPNPANLNATIRSCGDNPACTSSWTCPAWSTIECIDGTATRSCTDANACTTPTANTNALTKTCTKDCTGTDCPHPPTTTWYWYVGGAIVALALIYLVLKPKGRKGRRPR